mgnify:CR=1 FL=1
MKLFKKKRHVTLEDIYTIQQSILAKIEAKLSEREKRLEEMFFNAKAHRIVEYENQIKFLKSQIEDKDIVIEQMSKALEKAYKKKVKKE